MGQQTSSTSGSLAQADVCASGPSPETPKACSSYSFYAPLQTARREIRLIQIKPPSTDDIASCTLSVVSLDSNPKYAALSYVWGDPTATTAIVINGHQFQATKSLAKALVRIRREFARRPDCFFWVDAICINQKDELERSHQVQLMREIYSGSSSVISWLDSGDGQVGLGFRWIKVIAEEVYNACHTSTTAELFKSIPRESLGDIVKASHERGEQLDLTTWLNNHPALCRMDQDGKVLNEAWNTILAVVENRYWTRVWVFQELLLSHDGILLTDGPGISIDELYLVADWISFVAHRMNPLPDLIPRRLVTGLDIFIIRASSVSLCLGLSFLQVAISQYHMMNDFVRRETKLRILLEASRMQATDPRDHVYGLLGVMNASTEIVPDYSLPVGFVYRQWTQYVTACLGGLQILAEAGIGASREDPYDLPSWSPDWHSLPHHWNWSLGREKGANIRLEPILRHSFEFSENTNVLSADGVKIDRILAVEYIPEDFDELSSKPGIFFDTYMGLRSRVHPTGDPPLQVFCRTLVQDNGFYDLEPQNYPESVLNLAEDITSWTLDLGNVNILHQLALCSETASLELMLRDFFRPSDTAQYQSCKPRRPLPDDTFLSTLDMLIDMLIHLSGKSLFWTTEGYLGLANRAVVSGDFVCVLAACPIPVIIRKVESHCLLIGACFVHGLMDGQAARLLGQRKVTMERFEIH